MSCFCTTIRMVHQNLLTKEEKYDTPRTTAHLRAKPSCKVYTQPCSVPPKPPLGEARKAGLTTPVWENGVVVRKHPDEVEAEEAARQQ